MLTRLAFLMLSLFVLVACDDGVKTIDSCGDDIRDPAEACDGPDLGGANCTSVGFYTGTLACGADCQFDTDGCAGRCGDNILDDVEQCEGNSTGVNTCQTLGYTSGELKCDPLNCTFDTSSCVGGCGDGSKQGDEQCDDGNNEPNDGCSPGCLIDEGWTCSGNPSFCITACGDGFIAGEETCDGTNLDGESCESRGFYDGTLACTDCQFDQTDCSGTCGDGVFDGAFGEECDGTDLGGALCSDLGLTGSGLVCDDSCRLDASACTRWVSVSCGTSHTCALDSAGSLWCWGASLPAGVEPTEPPPNENIMTPVLKNLGMPVLQVATGNIHTCVILSNQSLWCWGGNTDFQLGAGILNAATRTPQPVSGLGSGVSAVAAGSAFTCAIANGQIYCWGANGNGQLGIGSTDTQELPQSISLPGAAPTTLATGASHTCVVNASGDLFCWGGSFNGQLGLSTTEDQLSPSQVASIDSIQQIYAGAIHTCAIKLDGTLWCWGSNFHGQLGNGTTVDSWEPSQVSSMGTAVFGGAAPQYSHNCFIKGDQTAWCWGLNQYGQLGNGTGGGGAYLRSAVPVAVSTLSGVISIGAGENHSCAVLADGTLWCWGSNEFGQLGNPTVLTDTNVPVQVVGE